MNQRYKGLEENEKAITKSFTNTSYNSNLAQGVKVFTHLHEFS